MLFELWGATGLLALQIPATAASYFLFLVCILGVVGGVNQYRRAWPGSRQIPGPRWLLFAGFMLAALLFSQLFPLRFPPDWPLLGRLTTPDSPLVLFALVPMLLAGVVFSPGVTAVIGLATGLGVALGQTHTIFDLFHYALAGFLTGFMLQQPYRGRFYATLRHPVIVAVLLALLLMILTGLTGLVSSTDNGYLAALDVGLARFEASFWPFLIAALVAGGVVTIIVRWLPQVRPARSQQLSPQELSLRNRLLADFTGFSLVLASLVLVVVFSVSVWVATRLIVNQMAHNTQTVVAEVPVFQAHLQGLVQQYNSNVGLLDESPLEKEKALRQIYRAAPRYRRILLINADQSISAVYPPENTVLALTGLEETAVVDVLKTSVPGMVHADIQNEEHVISLVVPVLDTGGATSAVLVGRVPKLSLDSLIVGLQGTVGEGQGFIVDEQSKIVADAEPARLLTTWRPPIDAISLQTGSSVSGEAYRTAPTNQGARELVYYETLPNQAWTVVLRVPYEVVLRLAINIAAPLMLVMLLTMGAFFGRLTLTSRKITEPVTALVKASQTIAAGEKWTPPQDAPRYDEIGQLTQSFYQMYQTRNKQLSDLSLLLNVSQAVASKIDIDQGMPAILRGALRGTGAIGARAVVRNPQSRKPLRYAEGPAAEAMAMLDARLLATLRHRGQGELLLTSLEQIRAVLKLSPDQQSPVRGLIAVTLHSQQVQQGILWLGYSNPHNVDPSVLSILHTLAGQAAVLVENARLFSAADGGRRRLAAILASTTDAVIVTDQTNRILFTNRALERIFDLDGGQINGRPVADIISDEILLKALTETESRMRNLEMHAPDGKTYYVNASIVRQEGQTLGRVAVVHDITHLKELDQVKSDFVATVSHDLRGPLTYMRGYVTLLPMMGELGEQQAEYVDKILIGIKQMSDLIDDLLDLGRIEAGIDLRYETIDINNLLGEIATAHENHAAMAGIQIQVKLASAGTTIEGDPGLIRQAVTNLVGNAIKYAPNSGPLLIHAERTKSEIVVSVKDNGSGIASGDQARLFEKFYRARTTENTVKGSGLGLSIVKSIAERHGGRVWVRSEVGQGSTFYILLPLKAK